MARANTLNSSLIYPIRASIVYGLLFQHLVYMINQPKPRPGILEIQPYVAGNVGIDSHEKIIQLASNESALGPSPKAVEAYRAAAAQLHRYPDGSCQALRNMIAEKHHINAGQIVCGNGSERLIDLLARAYAGPGDEILYSQYGFLMYPICSLAAGATPVTAAEQNFVADTNALLAAVTEKTRVIFLANPNNPTGTYLNKNALKSFYEQLPKNIVLVIDSAYAEFVTVADYSAGHELITPDTANVVVLHTFSKIHGLAALRLGWAYCAKPIAEVLNRIRGSFNINAAAQQAGIAALQDDAHLTRAREHNDKWLGWLQQALQTLGLQITPGIGNFVLTHFKDAEQCNAALHYLKQRGIIVRSVSSYGIPKSLRITVGLEHENKACIQALTEFLAQ